MNLKKLSFRDRIKRLNPNLKHIPKGFKRIENKIIVRHKEELDGNFGEAVLNSFSWCTGVFQHITTKGENRRPELKFLAGQKETVVTHVENNAKYHLDIENIMLSGGNRELRRRLAVEVKHEENLLDMFAAVGNLNLQVILKKSVQAILTEKDPYTFSFLEKTMKLNNLKPQMQNIDCRDLMLVNWADRIFLGYHDVDESHVRVAISASKHKSILHFHPLVHKSNPGEWTKKYTNWIELNGAKVVKTEERMVKSYSPNLDHIEIVITIEK